MARVELQNLRKSFHSTVAIDDVTLTIEDGEFMVLVGPSGCGKSTILRSIAGLSEVDSGDILIDGKRVNDLEPRERNLAMVFQNYALYPHMTVRKNIGFPLKMQGIRSTEIHERVAEAAKTLGLSNVLDRKPKTLSGGQMQRVALGRAIVRRPKVFLFDEPLSNLDAKMRTEMRAEISRLHKKFDATMVYVTHDQVEAMTLGSRIAVMNDGRIHQVGSPLDVYNHPKNRFVASFIGSPPMNFLNDLGIRPHDIVVCDDGPLQAEVDLIEPMGSETHVHCTVEGQPLLVVTKNPPDTSTLRLRFPENKIYRFS